MKISESKFMKAYEYIGMPFPTYLIKIFIPTFLALVAGYYIFLYLISEFLTVLIVFLLAFLLFFIATVILIFPYITYVRAGKLIDRDMHLFVTRLGILSLTFVSRKDLFNILSEMKEYRELAKEIKKIYTLISKWNVDLPEACRLVAEKTPSEQLSDFLIRMAHAVESGETAESFSQNEQKAAMEEYAIKYENAIESIGILNEIYLASVSSSLFFITVAAILPMLMGGDLTPFYLSLLLFLVIEVGVFYYIYISVPWEQIWETSAIETPIKVNVRRKLLLGISLIPVFVIIALILPVPFELKVAISISPLIIPGHYGAKTEEMIKKKEFFYPAFMRSLGTSAAGTGKETTFALKKLRYYKFGPLSEHINDLYNRLALRIDKHLAWKTFGAETGSDLISKFNDLYVDGTEVGGNAKEISKIISDNFLKMLALRKKRFLAASTTSGLLYGSMVFIPLPLYILVWVISLMNNMFIEIAPISEEYAFLSIFSGTMLNIDFLRIVMFGLVMGHVAVATAIKKVISASSNIRVLYDAVIMTWIGTLTAVITMMVINNIMI